VGTLAPQLADELLLWRVVCELRIPLGDLTTSWTLMDLLKANAYLDMKKTYSEAWDAFHEPEE
jgi:hypothetical protein